MCSVLVHVVASSLLWMKTASMFAFNVLNGDADAYAGISQSFCAF